MVNLVQKQYHYDRFERKLKKEMFVWLGLNLMAERAYLVHLESKF